MTNLGTNGCCGCRCCEQRCPKDAISIVQDAEGFLKPRINSRKCINCGLCTKVCPIENPVFYPPTKDARLFHHNDDDWRLSASSSGAFEAICRAWLKNENFSIFGCTLDGFRAYHTEVQDWNDLLRLKKSKYVQSDTGNTFTVVKQRLQEGHKVVFAGTPCQVMGLTNFLGKPYENLLTVDFVCHGTPSPLALKKYASSLRKAFGKSVKQLDFRHKYFDNKKGWTSLGMLAHLADGTQRHLPEKECEYMLYFLCGVMNGLICYNCPFTSTARCSDITLGDLWGVEKKYPELSAAHTDGVSMILLNSPKSKELNPILATENVRYEFVDIDFVTADNKQLKNPSPQHPRRKLFYRDLRLVGFNGAIKWLHYGSPLTRLKRHLRKKQGNK